MNVSNLSLLLIFLFPYIVYRLIKYNWYWIYIYPTMSALALILVITVSLVIEYYILRFTGFSFNKIFDYQQPLKEKFDEAKKELEYRNYNVEIIKEHNPRTASTRHRLVIKKNESEK